MFKELFFCLCIIHVICDFYLQTSKLAEKKKEQVKWILVHAVIYAIGTIILLKIFLPGTSLRVMLVIALSHAGIDLIKYYLYDYRFNKRKKRDINDATIFIADQILHLGILMVVAYSLKTCNISDLVNNAFVGLFNELNIPIMLTMIWVLKILIIHKPTNILISNILYRYRTEPKNEDNDKNAGRLIGSLERFIMIILMEMGHYSAVGLVLTAKSIARYNKISEEQEFAEYYLLGTLLSTICAILAVVLVKL